MDVRPDRFLPFRYSHWVCSAELYTAIYQHVLAHPTISELTVEDPAEAFEDLRDRCDLRMLLAHKQFVTEGFGELASGIGPIRTKGKQRRRAGKMGPPVEKGWAEAWRAKLKIAGVSVLC
jgi:histone acetyltransferase 1